MNVLTVDEIYDCMLWKSCIVDRNFVFWRINVRFYKVITTVKRAFAYFFYAFRYNYFRQSLAVVK